MEAVDPKALPMRSPCWAGFVMLCHVDPAARDVDSRTRAYSSTAAGWPRTLHFVAEVVAGL